jgi:ribosomal protein S18 acetylase RimI-like enzyme
MGGLREDAYDERNRADRARGSSSRHDGAVGSTPEAPLETLRMRIALPSEIPSPTWPEGMSVGGFERSGGRQLHALLEHGYRRGGGSVEVYDRWLPALTGDSEFEPQLCFLVHSGDDLAAAAICWSSGFVKDLVVRESWRRRGLGESLLHLAFRTFQARGATHVELKVQSQNASAIRLYERVGMRTIERIAEGQS